MAQLNWKPARFGYDENTRGFVGKTRGAPGCRFTIIDSGRMTYKGGAPRNSARRYKVSGPVSRDVACSLGPSDMVYQDTRDIGAASTVEGAKRIAQRRANTVCDCGGAKWAPNLPWGGATTKYDRKSKRFGQRDYWGARQDPFTMDYWQRLMGRPTNRQRNQVRRGIKDILK